MKKLLPLFLVLALLLTGCGLAEQAQTVKKEYIDPAVEAAKTGGTATTDAGNAGPSVKADWTAFLAWTAPETVGSRAQAQLIDTFAPSASYGTLTPFSGGAQGALYGLSTASGQVVLDPVLASCEPACWQDSAGADQYLPVYVASRLSDAGERTYGLIAMDGSWATDFLYTAVYPTELGCICVSDAQKNLAVCYGADGSKVFDTASFGRMGELKADSLSSWAACSSGEMLICYSGGQYGFIDKSGTILNRAADLPSYFDQARGFSEGRAAVCNYGKWGYLAADGTFAVERTFDDATSFCNGVALVETGGAWKAIDPAGTVLKEFPAGVTVTLSYGYVTAADASGAETYYLTPSLTEANMYDKELTMCAFGYWAKGDNGVRLRAYAGGEYYFPGAVSVDDACGGLYLVTLADGTAAAMDADGRVAAAGGKVTFAADPVSGAVDVFTQGSDGSYSACDMDGTLLATDVTRPAVCGGLFPCRDALTAGLRDAQDQWVLRLRVDPGD